MDYEPLDLSAFYNAGPEQYDYRLGKTRLFPFAANPGLGPQLFHGLPFHIGAQAPCFIGFQAGDVGAVTIPIQVSARWVIFAHALLETRLHLGGPMGVRVADYVFQFESGAVVRVPIRERFEIGSVPPVWGEACFLAIPDTKEGLMDRQAGRWGAAGLRQTEVIQSQPNGYYLWAWPNPRPAERLAGIVVEPAGPRFLIAAVTLGHLEENPCARPAKQVVAITLPQPAEAAQPFSLEVTVDRGVATFPYALPAQATDEFLADPMRGWGERQNLTSSPAYVEMAALPSATLSVAQAGQPLGQVRWRDLEAAGRVATPRLQLEVVEQGRNWVFTTVVDDATGEPLPCRVHFRSPQGIPYQPHGHHDHVNGNLDTWHLDVGGDVRLGQITYAYIDGRCQGWLPAGDVVVDVARGFEYEPLRERLTILPGQRNLTLRMKRMADMAAQRYFSGDTHVHFLSTQGSHLEAAGEDLRVVNLLLSQWGHLFTNTEEFTGRPSVSSDGRTIVYACQENRQHLLSHLSLLGLQQPVMPWGSDGPSEAELGGNLEVTGCHWADACHRQGGTVVIPHLPVPNAEPAALIATGRADAVEMLEHSAFAHEEYYRYLNAGYRLPLAGGTDKMASDVPVGLCRTYVYIPPGQEFTYENWLRGLRSGHTFISSGPLIALSVEGQPIGSLLRLPVGGGSVEVEASVQSIFPVHTLQLVLNGQVVAASDEQAGARRLALMTRVHVTESSWLAARCAGPGYAALPHHDIWGRGIMAHTSPVYLACGDTYERFSPETARYMLTLIEGSLAYVRTLAPQYQRRTIVHHHGEADHLAYLERPLLEAREAVHRRLHQWAAPH